MVQGHSQEGISGEKLEDDEMVASDCREDFFALQPNGKVHHFIFSKSMEKNEEKDTEIVI